MESKVGIETMIMILKQHGITMKVGGCGCCGSPYVTFKYEGQTILLNEDDCSFDTEEDRAQQVK